MYIKTTYYGYFIKGDEKIYGLYCGEFPINITILEEREILYPEGENLLVHKLTQKQYDTVYLKNADCEDNYTEMEIDKYENYTIN